MKLLQNQYTNGQEVFQEGCESPDHELNEQVQIIKSSNKDEIQNQSELVYQSVTIIIPTYRDWTRLAVCLSALEKQSYPREHFDIVIINNEPEDIVPAGFKVPRNAILIHEPKAGSYAARNAGLKVAKGEIIGFTDSDCTPDKHWIKHAVEYLVRHTSFTRIAGPVEILQKQAKPTVIEKYNQLYSFPQKWLISNGGGSVTANLFVWKTVFETVGGFDDTLLSMGDKFWGMKAQAAGFPIAYVENVKVSHPARDLRELIRKEKRHAGALSNTLPAQPTKLFLRFLYECRPRISGVRFMLGRRTDIRLIDRITLPFLRHYLLLVRIYESIKIRLGKKDPSRV